MSEQPEIMVEHAAGWYLNDVWQRPFLCTPGHEDELAMGYLLSQGILQENDDVLVGDYLGKIRVETRVEPLPQSEDVLERLESCPAVDSPLTVSREALRQACQALLDAGELFGTHRAMMIAPKGRVIREDVGRHNAVDKCVGHAYFEGWPITECVMGCTGRVSLEMLAKAAALGIPVFFTAKYPSDLAVQWAEKLGIAIIARAHRPDAAVHGAAWRVTEA